LGFDPHYGKSAIKTYRTYIDPKPSKLQSIEEQDISISAVRVARQIDFLAKRHRSHEAEWVRHTDEIVSQRTVFPLVLLLDNVRSAFNVGSIFRTADACGACLVLTTGITPHPGGSGSEKVAKSSLGAERIVPSQHFETTREAVEFVRKTYPKLMLVGMETTNVSVDYTKVDYPGKGQGVGPEGNPLGEGTLLVLGNEVTGVDTEIMPELDTIVEIPMFGVKNSLNIAACAPVVLYEILRQWGTS
jgi:tRNA G18 (ribose-2'-O)-methylase SpoU